ncbi:outer membrane protein, partial [Sphingomonas solaris]
MRKLAIMAALATTALAAPAMARDGAWYVGAEGGGMIVEDLKYDLTNAAGATVNNAYNVDSKYGFDVDGIVGYDFGAFRLEGEVGYKRAEVDEINGRRAGGNTTALSFMVNGLLDFGSDDGISGYVGGGAGVARVKGAINRFRTAPQAEVILLDDSDTRFAYQAIAGVRAPITTNIDIGLKYRFFNVDNVKTVAVTPANSRAETRFRSHSLLATIAYNFGEPAAPPPPPAAPAPPPPPPAGPPPAPVPTGPGPVTVFFPRHHAHITYREAWVL